MCAQLGPSERKLTTGGHLLIPRGMHFGPELFPDLVMPHNHMAPLIDSITWQEVPFQMVGPFQAMDPIFPGLPGDLELFTAEEVTKLKELGVLNLPPSTPGCLPLFPPLVPSSRGKVVSVTLGLPPPGIDMHGIGQSLTADQDEESVLSNSHSDCLSTTLDSSIMWGKHTVCSSDKEQKPRVTEHQDYGHKSGNKDHNKDCDRECEKSKKNYNRHGFDRPCRHSPWCKDQDGIYECSVNGKCGRLHGCDSPSNSRKTKQRWEVSTSPLRDCRKSHTPER